MEAVRHSSRQAEGSYCPSSEWIARLPLLAWRRHGLCVDHVQARSTAVRHLRHLCGGLLTASGCTHIDQQIALVALASAGLQLGDKGGLGD